MIAVLVAVGVYMASSRSSLSPPGQCRDRVDNDGDGRIDYPADSGCTNKFDNSEASCVVGSTSCGVGECRRTSTCVADQVSCSPGTPTGEVCGDGKDNDCNGVVDNGCNVNSTNTCGDTDGGNRPNTQGTVSGLRNGNSYSLTDFCLTTTNVFEYYCSGTNAVNSTVNCVSPGNVTNGTTSCSAGACV